MTEAHQQSIIQPVLLDLKLPNVDRLEVLKCVKTDPRPQMISMVWTWQFTEAVRQVVYIGCCSTILLLKASWTR